MMQRSAARITVSLMLMVLLLGIQPAWAGKAITKDYPLTRLTEKVYVIYGPNEQVNKQNKGFHNNPVIVLTREGVVVLDPGASVYTGEMIVEKISEVTDQPVVAVFDSHAHGDHWLGNHGIRKHYPDVTIYAHPNMKQSLDAGAGQMWVKAINKRTDGAIEGTKVVGPDKTVSDGDELKFGNVTFRVHHTGKAHTNNDIMLEIIEEDIFLFGDNLRIGNISPFMASFSGNLKALEEGEQLDAKVYVPGHGKGGGKERIAVYREFITKLKREVTRHYKNGLSDFEMKPKVIKAMSEYKDWAGFDENLGRLINLAYLEVEQELF